MSVSVLWGGFSRFFRGNFTTRLKALYRFFHGSPAEITVGKPANGGEKRHRGLCPRYARFPMIAQNPVEPDNQLLKQMWLSHIRNLP